MVTSNSLPFTSASAPYFPPSRSSPLFPLHYHSVENPGHRRWSDAYYLGCLKEIAVEGMMMGLLIDILEREESIGRMRARAEQIYGGSFMGLVKKEEEEAVEGDGWWKRVTEWLLLLE